jgi:putative isomerase
VLNPEEFLSPYGIRSMAMTEPYYNNAPTGNPSNWNGPVWGLSTFLTAYGLARYGFRDEALEIAGRLIDVYAGDLRKNGLIHEYYNADTGEPVIKAGFLSWNILATRVCEDIRSGHDPMAVE